jgi:glycosyltransferase involved in cell wall biosynthesis
MSDKTILFIPMHNDPLDLSASSSVEYFVYEALKVQYGAKNVRILKPVERSKYLLEKLYQKIIRQFDKWYSKWSLKALIKVNFQLKRHLKQNPEVQTIVTLFPSTYFLLFKPKVQIVFITDLTFKDWKSNGAKFDIFSYFLQRNVERIASYKASKIITHSTHGRDQLMKEYRLNPNKIFVLPMPSAIPIERVNRSEIGLVNFKKIENNKINLLLVGRNYYRKGIDIALKVNNELNNKGYDSTLTICGSPPIDNQFENGKVRFVGTFDKRFELQQYVQLYKDTHLLIHPARYEPAGIVPSEAAMFGKPTITNDTGGLATQVVHGKTGIVLPKSSSFEKYVEVIIGIIETPETYRSLCEGAFANYEEKMNWGAAGRTLKSIIDR